MTDDKDVTTNQDVASADESQKNEEELKPSGKVSEEAGREVCGAGIAVDLEQIISEISQAAVEKELIANVPEQLEAVYPDHRKAVPRDVPQPDEMEPDMPMSHEEMEQVAAQLCRSKAEELAVLGYRDIDPQTIWEIVAANYPDKGFPRLHQLVNDILSLKPNRVMNHMMMEVYKQSEGEQSPFR